MFRNLRLGLKIGLSFFFVLAILSIVLVIGVFALKKANDGITTYEALANETNLSGRLQANMLMVRINVLGYLNTQSDNNLTQYKDYFDKINTLLVQSKKEIKQPERAQIIDSLDSAVTQYNNTFSIMVSLTQQQKSVLNEQLIPCLLIRSHSVFPASKRALANR